MVRDSTRRKTPSRLATGFIQLYNRQDNIRNNSVPSKGVQSHRLINHFKVCSLKDIHMRSTNIIRRLVILLIFFPAGCTGILPQTTFIQTPSPVIPAATHTPIPTLTPPATYTPVYSPTPETLPAGFIEVCEEAFSENVTDGTPQLPVLYLSILNYESRGWEILGLVRHPMAAFKTLACIKETRQQVFTYSDGAAGWRLGRDVRLVEVGTGNVIGADYYVGGDPPAIKFRSGDAYGSTPGIKMLTGVVPQEESDTIRLDVTGSVIAASPDGKTFVHLSAGSDTGTGIVLRDAKTRQDVGLFESRDYPSAAEFSSDGKYLLITSASSQRSTLWEVASGSIVQTFAGRLGTLSPDGTMVAVIAEDDETLMEKLVVMDAISGEEIQSIYDLFQFPFYSSIRFSPDGRTLVFESQSVVIWNIAEWRMERTIQTMTGGETLAFSPTGNMLATASKFSAAIIELWSPETGELIHTIGPIGNPEIRMRVKTASFSPDGRFLAAGLDDGTVRVWETTTWLEIHTYYGQFGDVDDIDFSPDGNTLYAAVLAQIKIFDLTIP